MKKIFIVSLFVLLGGCQSAKNNDQTAIDSAKVILQDSTNMLANTAIDSAKVEKQYAYLKKIYQKEGKWFVDADYIQFLTGDAAVKQARKRGDAIADVDKNNDTTYSVPDDYYILNENKKIRTFELAESAKVVTLDVTNTGLGEHLGIDYLAKNLSKKTELPFILKIYNGKIIDLREQFVP